MAYYDRDYYREDGAAGPLGSMRWATHPVTIWLITINVALFFIDGLTSRIAHGGDGQGLLTDWGGFNFTAGVLHFQAWRFFTYQFLHGGFGHLFWNMLGLFFFGPMVENHLGPRRYLAYYLLCGVAGSLLYMLLMFVGQAGGPRVPFALVGSPDQMLVGASGAIFGILIAGLRIAPTMTVMLMFIIPVQLRVIVLIALLATVYSVMVVGDAGGAAHLGGAILGAVLIRHPDWLDFADRASLGRFSPAHMIGRRKMAAKQKRIMHDRDFEARIDRILDKVNEHGLQSLTAKEKKMLQQATERQRQA